MEELLYFFLIIIIGLFILIPIIILSKVSSVNKKTDALGDELKELNNRILFLLEHGATKYDIDQVLKAMKHSGVRSTEASVNEVTEPVSPVSQPKEEIVVQPQVTELVEEPLVEPVVELPAEESRETVETETEAEHAVFAAIEKPMEEVVVAAVQQPQPQLQPQPRPIVASVSEDEYDTPEKTIVEKLLGGNLLAKIGIVTLVLGIGFFVKYAIDQGWINEVGRVAIGLLTGGIIIGVAHKLKERYSVFSSILVGGGISVFYITITLAFREYEIFSQTVAFVLLIAVTVFSVILSLFYNRQELAIFSLIGGVLAPLMISTGEGNYIVLFSYMLILNTGMLIISLKKSWNLIGIFAYISSLLFFWAWLGGKFIDQYLGATIFASLFFVQFYVLAIIKHFREGKRMTMFQAVLILTNNLSVLLATMYIFSDYTFDLRGIATMVIATVNAVVMLTLFRQSTVDKNMIYLIIAVVMSFVTLAVPIQLRGHVITMFWAAETVLLLWLWQRSKINVFRIGFLLIALLSLLSYLMDVSNNYGETVGLTILVNRIFITGVVLVAGFGVSILLLRKEDRDEMIKIKSVNVCSVGTLLTFFKFAFTILVFFVPFLELNYQLEAYTEVGTYVSSFRYLTLATYIYLFICGLAILSRDKINNTRFNILLGAFGVYAVIYTLLTVDLRYDIYMWTAYPNYYLLIHLITLPVIAYIVYLLIKQLRSKSEGAFKVLSWVMVILSVIVLSVELDTLVVMAVGHAENYHALLYDVHTFGYPILWGLIAGGLMVWGLKGKEVLLRKISLISFAVIIVKFYAYDVWYMSQAGRIVSFVILGVILLSVSFMQQKIKTLVKEDIDTSETENKEI